MLINRDMENELARTIALYPVVFLTGPRQSGKSTLLRNRLPDYSYVTLEDPDVRGFALNDPRGFLKTYGNKAIIDEAQRVPQLFSYIQTRVDADNLPGMFVLSGSQNFLMMQSIGQSLAGRVGILKLLPFSFNELRGEPSAPEDLDDWLFTGGYPRIYDKGVPPARFYSDYIQSYLERDVRLLKNIGDLDSFLRFIRLCAGRAGRLLNLSALADAGDISVQTVRSWLSVLEASYVIYTLQPHQRNFNKRISKSPKLYFYDTGLLCALLNIDSAEQLTTHYLRGEIFENMAIAEYLKAGYAHGEVPRISFWRDNNGTEVDLLVEKATGIAAYEFKSAATFKPASFKNLNRFATYAGPALRSKAVVYGGDDLWRTSEGDCVPWRRFP
jgi:predicted AAA+ superfamily ATPase